jgi:hypothetical protein
MPGLTREISLPSFDSVAPSSTATLSLSVGQSYHWLGIEYAGTGMTLAKMTAVRFKVNGQTVIDLTGTQIDLLNQYFGQASAATAKILYLDFRRLGVILNEAQEMTILRMGNRSENPRIPSIQTAVLEIDVSDPTSVTLSAFASVSGPEQPGYFQKMRRVTYSPSGAGQFDIADIIKGDLYAQIFLSSTVVTAAKLTIDSYTYFDRTSARNTAVQTDGVCSPQSNLFAINPAEWGHHDRMIATRTLDGNLVGDFRLQATVSGAGDIDLITKSVGIVGG